MKTLEVAPMIRLVLAVAVAGACADTAWSEVRVTDVALAAEVSSRQPVGAFDPPAVCSTERPADVPRIDARQNRRVFVWTKIESAGLDAIRHVYYMSEARIRTEETSYSFVDRILNRVAAFSASIGRIATVTLRLNTSTGWRTWSKKEIDRGVHRGDWRVEIRTVQDDNDPLCTIHFTVE